jgi:hypothetical protein
MDQLLRALLQVQVDPFLGTTDQPIFGEVGKKEVHTVPAGPRKARRMLAEIASIYPGMFAHWRHGALPTGSTTGAV